MKAQKSFASLKIIKTCGMKLSCKFLRKIVKD